jgi:hypothetical protein
MSFLSLLFICSYSSGYLLRPRVPSSNTQGSQTYKHHLIVGTPLYRHTTIIAHEFSPNKSQRIKCSAALQFLEVWPPSKGVCLPPESPQPAREEEGAHPMSHYAKSRLTQCTMKNKYDYVLQEILYR